MMLAWEQSTVERIDVALLGGGFNPIATQHQLMGELIWEELQMPTWMMPCYRHRFAKDSQLAESSHRWNMTSEVTMQFSFLTACDTEIFRQHNGAMTDTLQELSYIHPDIQFHIVIGMDNANVIKEKWFRGKYLIQEHPFIVFQRTGEEPKDNWFLEEPHRLLTFDHKISSTDIRNAIHDGNYDFAQKHLNPMVWDYIVAGHLYGYGEKP